MRHVFGACREIRTDWSGNERSGIWQSQIDFVATAFFASGEDKFLLGLVGSHLASDYDETFLSALGAAYVRDSGLPLEPDNLPFSRYRFLMNFPRS